LLKLSVDLNDELAKHSENPLYECMLTGRIFSTLVKEYDNFKDVWVTIPTSTQTVNLLIEKLCAIELRADRLASAEAMALVTDADAKTLTSSRNLSTSSPASTATTLLLSIRIETARDFFLPHATSSCQSPSTTGKQLLHW
jgi:hypothetical protein